MAHEIHSLEKCEQFTIDDRFATTTEFLFNPQALEMSIFTDCGNCSGITSSELDIADLQAFKRWLNANVPD